jgi:hypothetical protein
VAEAITEAVVYILKLIELMLITFLYYRFKYNSSRSISDTSLQSEHQALRIITHRLQKNVLAEDIGHTGALGIDVLTEAWYGCAYTILCMHGCTLLQILHEM